MINKILLSIDDSKYTENNLRYMIEFTKRIGASLTILYVVSLPSILAPEAYIDPKPFIEAGEKFLDEIKEKVKGIGVAVTTELEMSYGNPAHKIIEFGKVNNFDLIAIGARGKSTIRNLLLGSVAETVMRNASCPVLVIR